MQHCHALPDIALPDIAKAIVPAKTRVERIIPCILRGKYVLTEHENENVLEEPLVFILSTDGT